MCDQDVCAYTLFKCPWPVYPSSSVVLSSNGWRSSGKMGFASHSSVWKISFPSDNSSGLYQMPLIMEREDACFYNVENMIDIDTVCFTGFRLRTNNWRTLGGVFYGSLAVVGQQRWQGIIRTTSLLMLEFDYWLWSTSDLLVLWKLSVTTSVIWYLYN